MGKATFALVILAWFSAVQSSIGVAVRCDSQAGTFELLPVISGDDGELDPIPVQDGFRSIPRGMAIERCKIGEQEIVATIVSHPADQGMCMGDGYIQIKSLVSHKQPLLPLNQAFNWHCHPQIETLVKVKATSKGKAGIELELCNAAPADEGNGYGPSTCGKVVR